MHHTDGRHPQRSLPPRTCHAQYRLITARRQGAIGVACQLVNMYVRILGLHIWVGVQIVFCAEWMKRAHESDVVTSHGPWGDCECVRRIVMLHRVCGVLAMGARAVMRGWMSCARRH